MNKLPNLSEMLVKYFSDLRPSEGKKQKQRYFGIRKILK